MILDLLASMAKVFSFASSLNLPLTNFRRFCLSSIPILILILFLFTAGETKTIIPAMIIVVLYVFLELPSLILDENKLRAAERKFEEYKNF